MDFLRKCLPGNLERYLDGLDFPITKQELVGRLEQNGAPGMLVEQFRKRLPEREYSSPQDLLKALRG
jgi:hypothetical protein